jgi:uncharacterized protein YegP (UPF0339 family)
VKTVQIVRTSFGRYFVRLVSSNGEILAHSEVYYSRFNARRAAKKNFPGIKVVEVSQ